MRHLWYGELRSLVSAALWSGRVVRGHACREADFSTSGDSFVLTLVYLDVHRFARRARHASSSDLTVKCAASQSRPGWAVVPLPLTTTASCSHVRSHGWCSKFSKSATPVFSLSRPPYAGSVSPAVSSVLRSMKRADSLDPSKERRRCNCSSLWVSGSVSVRAMPAMQNATSGLCWSADHRWCSHARSDGSS